MKRALFALPLLGALLAPASAQVNTVPQVGVSSAFIYRNTYSAVALALPPAASATDIACIAGSATKTIYLSNLYINGVAGTLVNAPFTLVRRTTADTGGTAATTTANWANTISKHDTNNPAATATLISYSANPTINDTSPVYLRSAYATIPTTAATTLSPIVSWHWESAEFEQRPVLRGAAQQFCVNLNAVSISSGLLHISITWTEE